ncbi:MAG: SDR family oxidoreductase [Candidatus Omnitrophica bacterium]|nr:SDR family oxidoreductase [Candidatus Omnitrophota bacterium]
MLLPDRVALVTGGARRVGRAIAGLLAAHRAHVVISYRTSRTEAQRAVSELRSHGQRAEAVRADVTVSRDIERLMRHIHKRFGRLDVLVNNAAVFARTPFDRLSEQQWDAHLNANLKGPFLCALAASRLMKRQGAGKIINIADWAGVKPYRDYLPYCVSKAALLGLTKALAKELAPTVQVVAVAPGPVMPPPEMTPSERRRVMKRVPLQRWGSPDDIAQAVLFAIQGTDFMTGSTIFVDGGQLIA